MAIPDYQTLMLPVIKASAEGLVTVPVVADKIADDLNLTDAERNQLLPSGRQKLIHNRIHWAKFYLSKAGLIDTPSRGKFVISEAGSSLLAARPARIDKDLLLQFPAFQEFIEASSRAGDSDGATSLAPVARPPDDATPEEQIDGALSALQAALRGELLSRLISGSAGFFEGVIVDLLVAMGYGGSHQNAATTLGRSGDGGVDGVINEDRLGLDRVYIQAKCWRPEASVGRPHIQGFLGSLVGLGASKGVFVTTSSFSEPAIDFVKPLPQRIVLIDGAKLADLMIEHNVGIRVSRTVDFKRIDEDFFSEEG